MTGPSVISSHRKRYNEFVGEVADWVFAELRLDENDLRRLIENDDEFRARFVATVHELSISNQFANEEVASNYGYRSGYQVPICITDQVKLLRSFFPELGGADESIVEKRLPPDAEGWFAIPRWEKLASTYGEALAKVLAVIGQTRNGNLRNYCRGRFDIQHLRQHKKTAKAFQKIGDEQKGCDILIVPAQFGFHHRGRSVRRARELMNASEFGLGTFAIGIMLLTNPIRLHHYHDLWIDCPGDEFVSIDDEPSHAPVFLFRGGKVRLSYFRINHVHERWGSPSAFLLS